MENGGGGWWWCVVVGGRWCVVGGVWWLWCAGPLIEELAPELMAPPLLPEIDDGQVISVDSESTDEYEGGMKHSPTCSG